MKMINILYVLSTLEITGPTNQLFNIVSNLDPQKFRARVVTLSPEKERSFLQKFLDKGIDIKSAGKSRLSGLFGNKNFIENQIKHFKADILHTQGIRADTISASIADIPRIATLRNVPYKDYPMAYGKLIGYLMSHQHLKALNKIEYPVTVSESVKSEVQPRLKMDIQVVANGVDMSFFCRDKINRNTSEAISKQFFLNRTSHTFVYTGIIEPRKNLEILIHTFSGLPDCTLLIVGTGSQLPHLQSLASKYGAKNIHFIGGVSDVRPYLSVSDCFISLSLAEGLPNSLIEALAMGLPAIVSNIAPHQEVANYEFLPIKSIDANDQQRLIDFIKTQKDHLIKKASRNNTRQETQFPFSAATMSNRYQQIYSDICRGKECPPSL